MDNHRISTSKLLSVFRNRVVLVILTSILCSQAGIWIRYYAVMMYVIERTGQDPFALSMLAVAEFAPVFLFGFIGGAFADRWPPKRRMILCDLINALSAFGVLAVFASGVWQAVYLAPLVYAMLQQFTQPAGLKLFKRHLREDEMQAGISAYQTVFFVFMLLGPVLGTIVFQKLGIAAAIALMGVMFLLSAIVQTFLPADGRTEKEPDKRAVLSELKQGFAYLLSEKALRTLGICFVLIYAGFGLVQPMQVFLVSERLGLDADWLQWLMTVNGAGTVAGGVLITLLSGRITGPQNLLVAGIAAHAAGVCLSVMSGQLWLTLSAQFVCGLTIPLIHIGSNTWVLHKSKAAFVGRVNGILIPLNTASALSATSIVGMVKDDLSIFGVYGLAAGLFILALIVIVLLIRRPVERGKAALTQSRSES